MTADFNGDGKPDLVSSDGTVLLGKGDGTFTTGTSLSVTGNAIAVGDFNGDGKADVIVANSSTALSVLLGNGDGTFQAAITVNAGAALSSLVVADFNGDGKQDVAGVNAPSGLFVLLGNGSGSFIAASGSPLTLPATSLIVAGDFNGDGKIDLAYGSSSNSSAGIPGGVFLGNGDGTFKTGAALTIGLETVTALAAADLTGRGKLDLVISGSTSSTPEAVVLRGNGDGTFQLIDSPLAGGGAIAITDLTGNHQQNIILNDGIVVRVFVGLGDGTYLVQNTYLWAPNNTGSNSVVAADFNGDAKPDIAAKNLMLLGNGDGTLQGNDAIIGSGVVGGILGDFNSDGSPDVITSDSSNVNVLLNDGTGKFIQAHSYPNPAQPIAAGDVNRDGKLDVLLSTSANQTLTLSVMLGNGDGTFASAISTGISSLAGVAPLKLVDLNGDQIPDLLALTAQGVSVFLGKGDGTFSASTNYFAGANPTTLRVGDFNNDGIQDVVVGSDAGIGVLIGNGDGTFASVVLSGIGPIGFSAVGDVNGDGKLDLIAPGSSLTVYLGSGDGTFQAPLNTAPNGPADGFDQLFTADADGDGKLDVVASTGIWFVPGNGDGTFQSPIGVLRGGSGAIGPFINAVADLNSDGRPDVLITTQGNQTEQGFATFLNTGGATGPNFKVAATPAFPASVKAAGTATSTVTVTMSNGFTANVALSCIGLPVGSSCVFAPATSGAGTVVSTLTIDVGSTTPGGTYYISVVGTGGGLTRSRLLTLSVTAAAPDFVLSTPSGASSTVTAGNPATYSLSIGGSGGFAGNVALSCSGAPTAAVCTITPSSVSVSGSSAATATVTVTTTARSEMVTPVTGRDDRWTPGIYGTSRIVVAGATVAISFALLGILGLRAERRFSRVAALGGVLLVLAAIGIGGCGGGTMPSGGGGTGTPAGSYTITVSATAGSGANAVTHTTQLTLVVQ